MNLSKKDSFSFLVRVNDWNYSKFVEENKKYAGPVANAGEDVTIYLTETSTATLDGSKSVGESFMWKDITSTIGYSYLDVEKHPINTGKITNPDSKITSVTGLSQGTWYYQLTVTSNGIAKRDTVVIRADHYIPPRSGKVIMSIMEDYPEIAKTANQRYNKTNYFLPWDKSNINAVVMLPKVWWIYRDVSMGCYIDTARGKMYNVIIDGHHSYDANYTRTEMQPRLNGRTPYIDTNKVYIYEWKGYFPQDPKLPNGKSAMVIMQIHGADAVSPPFALRIKGDQLAISENFGNGNGQNGQKKYTGFPFYDLMPIDSFFNKTRTVRLIFREGKGYIGQTAFLKVEIDGVEKYYRNDGQVGQTFSSEKEMKSDYLKFSTIYDAGNNICDANNLTRNKKFALVTESFKMIELLPLNNLAVDPGKEQIIELPQNIAMLSGSCSIVDGKITSYKWSKKSGPSSYRILNNKSDTTEVTDLVEGVYEFELTVTDDKGATGSAVVKVTVLPPANLSPTVIAGPEQTIKLPTNSVSLNGSATDKDGTIVTYTWKKISGPAAFKIESPNSAATIVSGLATGTYRFVLTATDDKGATGSDTVKVIVVEEVNKSPKAIVANDIQITLPVDSAWLTGSVTDEDGSVVAFNWTKFSGPENFKLLNPDSAITLVTGLREGVYAFQLEVTDDKGATGMAILNVTVFPHSQIKPVADAGSDLYVTLPQDSVRLTGIGQSADAEIVTYNWTKKSGPPEFKIIDPDSSVTDITMLSEGVYEFWFEVTDSKGNTAIDSVKVTVSQSTNKAPVAIPGENQSITLPDSHIYLNGSGYDEDGNITSYRWTHVSGPKTFIIENPDSSYTKVSNLIPGNYQFELTVTDNEGATGSARISISVNPSINKAPIVHAGKDQTITLPLDSVYLKGSGLDEDGEIIQFQWTKISGPSSHFIQSPSDSATQINNLVAGIYQFRLTATDDQGAVGYDIVKITVNAQTNKTPEAIVEKDMNITLPLDSVILRGSGYDEDGEIVSYKWTKVSGPQSYILSDSLRATTTVTGLEEGTYRFQLEVMDDKGAIGIAVIMVTVNRAPNKPPLADAGADIQITLPKNSVKLTGKGYDEDGEIVFYEWTKKSGPAKFTIVTPEAATTDISNLTEGIYEFRLEVIDNEGAASTDIVKVTVNPAVNKAPTANAGPDQTLTLPINSVQLTGSGKDEDGSIVKYKWVKKSGPASGVIKNADAATTLVTGLVQGVYQFELIVTDDKGATGSAIVKITVNPIPNKPPKANAGKDQSITLPENSVILSGSGTDEDGTIRSYNWSKISGPASFKIENFNSPETRVTNLVAGVYQFRLAVQDNDGATGTAIVKITVIKEPNKAPIAFAGNDQVITLPANSVKLTGTASDEDGSLVDYKWTKISGPSTYKIMDPGSLITDVTGLTEGVYQFELKVTDNEGASGLSMVKITVKPKPNKPPVANAGKNATITLPNNTVSLSGSGSDEDGKVVSYQWTKKSGPSQFRIVNAKSPVTDVTELVEGVYIFELTVTDDRGAKGAAAVTITVKANPIKPIADAGEDITIVWPQNSATLLGSGHSLNGKIIKYQWRQISGPSTAILQFPDSSRTMVSELIAGNYSFVFTVMDQKNMTATDTMDLTVAAARLDTRKSEINIYPNPVGDFAMLDISGVDPNQKLSILIFDLGGKVVLRKDIMSSGSSSHKERIDFTNQPAGMYIITLHSAEGVILTSKKIIKSE